MRYSETRKNTKRKGKRRSNGGWNKINPRLELRRKLLETAGGDLTENNYVMSIADNQNACVRGKHIYSMLLYNTPK
jgi:hypothetical protein